MRIRLIAVGSTGDVQPMTVLGKALKARGHEVSLAAFEALRAHVEGAGLDYFRLPGDAERYIGSIIQPGANPATYLTRLESSLAGVIEPLLDAIYDAYGGVDAVVQSFLGAVPYCMAEAHGVPFLQSNYCLTDLTGEHCLPVMRQPYFGASFNRWTYQTAYKMIGQLEKRCVAPWCEKRNIRFRTIASGPDYHVGGHDVPVVCAFSEQVVPRPPEWSNNIHITGFWDEEAVPDYRPEPDLQAFLDAGAPPVYIGFGSMTSGDMGKALSSVLQALDRTGLRALLSSGWGGLDATDIPDTVHIIHEYVPHGWLFEHVQAVVHHGGAGTTAAGLLSGKPSLVVPFGSDQYFWSDRVHALGCGPRPLPRTALSAHRLVASLTELVQTPAYVDNAQAIRLKLCQERGTQTAAALNEKTADEW